MGLEEGACCQRHAASDMYAQAVNTMLLKQTLWAVNTRHNTGQRAGGVRNRAEDSAHRVWQQWLHVDSNHTSGPESDDLALDVALSYAGAVAKL